MDTLQVKVIVMNTLSDSDFIKDPDMYLQACQAMYEWLAEEFKVEGEDNVRHLSPVN